MDESIRIIWGLIGLLIGAGLLTHLTRGSGCTLRYEYSSKKKGSKKKRRIATQQPILANEEKAEIVYIDALPLSGQSSGQTDLSSHN